MASGRFALHWDGTGQELPNIPRLTQSDLQYHFAIIPTNQYGQAADGATTATVSAVLPDTLPPNQPVTVSVDPVSWNRANTSTLVWAGILDQPDSKAGLGNGNV